MPDNLYFTVEFHKRRDHISIENNLRLDEQHEAAEQALLIVESLVFFVTEAGKSDEFTEASTDELIPYFNNIKQVISGFLSAVHNGLDEIEKRRDELEEIVAKL